MTGHRRAAADAQPGEQRALGGVVTSAAASDSARHSCDDARVVGARLQRQRALPDRRQHARRVQPLGDARRESRGDRAPRTRGPPASTTPSATLRSRVSTLPRRISIDRSARAARTWQTRRRLDVPTRLPAGSAASAAAVAADDRVARIGARRHGDDRQAGRQLGGHVLHAVHGDVDLAGEQAFLDLLDPDALAAEIDHRPGLHAIALR